MATINVIIPVFNRLEWTVGILEQLRAQSTSHVIKITVVDDGSTDGTGQYLQSQRDIVSLVGDGNLWWAGSINLGINYLINNGLHADDYVIFLNNDVYIDNDYIDSLINASLENGNIPVGSILCESINSKVQLKSIGPIFDERKIDLHDAYDDLHNSNIASLLPVYEVDALSGRGTVYPGFCIIKNGLMRSLLLPHYYADYEYSARLKKHGVRLIVSSAAIIKSPPEYGNDTRHMKFAVKWFSKKSADNILCTMIFYSIICRWPWKIKALLVVSYPFIKDFLGRFSLSLKPRNKYEK